MSGLGFNYEVKEQEMAATFVATERLCLTAPDESGEQRLVPEGSPEARWLFCVPGKEIPLPEAEKYGLVNAAGEPSAAGGEKSIDQMSGKECDALAAKLEVDGWDAKAKVPAKREVLKALVEAPEQPDGLDDLSDDDVLAKALELDVASDADRAALIAAIRAKLGEEDAQA